MKEEWQQLALTAQDCARGYTGCLLGDPIGCGGVRVDKENRIGEVWALFSPLVKALPLSLFRIASRGLAEVIEEENLVLVWSIVDPRNDAAVRFVRHLGFERHLRLCPTQDLFEKRTGGR